jgi:hypothetical protein
MGRIGKRREPPKQEAGKPEPPQPAPREEDEAYEDGDIATPKRDRYGPDDEPL